MSHSFYLLQRLSALAGDRLRDNNAAIADLSDENRPINLGEKFSELYDNQWTDAMENLEGNLGMSELEAIQCLLRMIQVILILCHGESGGKSGHVRTGGNTMPSQNDTGNTYHTMSLIYPRGNHLCI